MASTTNSRDHKGGAAQQLNRSHRPLPVLESLPLAVASPDGLRLFINTQHALYNHNVETFLILTCEPRCRTHIINEYEMTADSLAAAASSGSISPLGIRIGIAALMASSTQSASLSPSRSTNLAMSSSSCSSSAHMNRDRRRSLDVEDISTISLQRIFARLTLSSTTAPISSFEHVSSASTSLLVSSAAADSIALDIFAKWQQRAGTHNDRVVGDRVVVTRFISPAMERLLRDMETSARCRVVLAPGHSTWAASQNSRSGREGRSGGGGVSGLLLASSSGCSPSSFGVHGNLTPLLPATHIDGLACRPMLLFQPPPPLHFAPLVRRAAASTSPSPSAVASVSVVVTAAAKDREQQRGGGGGGGSSMKLGVGRGEKNKDASDAAAGLCTYLASTSKVALHHLVVNDPTLRQLLKPIFQGGGVGGSEAEDGDDDDDEDEDYLDTGSDKHHHDAAAAVVAGVHQDPPAALSSNGGHHSYNSSSTTTALAARYVFSELVGGGGGGRRGSSDHRLDENRGQLRDDDEAAASGDSSSLVLEYRAQVKPGRLREARKRIFSQHGLHVDCSYDYLSLKTTGTTKPQASTGGRRAIIDERQEGEGETVMPPAGRVGRGGGGLNAEGDSFSSSSSSFLPGYDLRPEAKLRPYQIEAVDRFLQGGVAHSGIIVLPCGAGKTLTGIAASVRVQQPTLVVCINALSVLQWRSQFLKWTTLASHRVTVCTGKTKELPGDVFITTYAMLTSEPTVSAHGEYSEDQRLKRDINLALQTRTWGVLLLDEVHGAPADCFQRVLDRVRFRCSLGLTATLLREDGRIGDLRFLLGPKLYEANWLQLTSAGYLAPVACVEIRCPTPRPVLTEYLKAGMRGDEPLRTRVECLNPEKLWCIQALLYFHCVVRQPSDKVLIFCDSTAGVAYLARMLGVPMMDGATQHDERRRILMAFQRRSSSAGGGGLGQQQRGEAVVAATAAHRPSTASTAAAGGGGGHRQQHHHQNDGCSSSSSSLPPPMIAQLVCNVLVLSRVGDTALDLPEANVVIQVSGQGASRRQEAQRLGRILRPKPASIATAAATAHGYFYTLTSDDTDEVLSSASRQRWLRDQGFEYRVATANDVSELAWGRRQQVLLQEEGGGGSSGGGDHHHHHRYPPPAAPFIWPGPSCVGHTPWFVEVQQDVVRRAGSSGYFQWQILTPAQSASLEACYMGHVPCLDLTEYLTPTTTAITPSGSARQRASTSKGEDPSTSAATATRIKQLLAETVDVIRGGDAQDGGGHDQGDDVLAVGRSSRAGQSGSKPSATRGALLAAAADALRPYRIFDIEGLGLVTFVAGDVPHSHGLVVCRSVVASSSSLQLATSTTTLSLSSKRSTALPASSSLVVEGTAHDDVSRPRIRRGDPSHRCDLTKDESPCFRKWLSMIMRR